MRDLQQRLTPPRLDFDHVVAASTLNALAELLDEEVWPDALWVQRWFGEKRRLINTVESTIVAAVEHDRRWFVFALLDVSFLTGPNSIWFVPFVLERKPTVAALATVKEPDGKSWLVAEAAGHPAFQKWLLESAATGAPIRGSGGDSLEWQITGSPLTVKQTASRLLTGEQSNSSIVYGDQLLIKVMRRVQPGVNPDVELGRYLTQQAGLDFVPKLRADWSLRRGDETSSLAVAQEFIPGGRDGWEWFLSELARAGSSPKRQEALLDAVRRLAERLATLHRALAGAEEPGLAPLPITDDDLDDWRQGIAVLLSQVIGALELMEPDLEHETVQAIVTAFLTVAPFMIEHIHRLEALRGLLKTRVHGDFHLGQTLRRGEDWIILDFEGEPARPLEARRAHSSPLKDVAGLLRSIDYALVVARGNDQSAWLDAEGQLKYAFIERYREALDLPGLIPETDEGFMFALKALLIDKALYEIAYEIDNRPGWLWVPIESLLRFFTLDQVRIDASASLPD